MEIKVRRNRCADWSDEETIALVQLKKKAHLNNEIGNPVWIQISGEISKTVPQPKSAKQCRMRWDTLKKVYNAIEKYCIENGQEHSQLDKELLESMKLPTAYLEDWYTVVKEVQSEQHRKRNVIATFTYQKKSTSIDDVQSSTRPNVDVENPIVYPEDDSKKLLLEEIEVLKSKLQVVEQRQQHQSAQIDMFVSLFYTHNSTGLIHSVEQTVDSELVTRTDSVLFAEPGCLRELHPPQHESSDIVSCTIYPQLNSASSSDHEFVHVPELPSSWGPASPGQCLGEEISTGIQEIDSCTDSSRFLESEGPEVLWYEIESFYSHSSRWRKWKEVLKFVVKLLVTIPLKPALKRTKPWRGL